MCITSLFWQKLAADFYQHEKKTVPRLLIENRLADRHFVEALKRETDRVSAKLFSARCRSVKCFSAERRVPGMEGFSIHPLSHH
jgi:hypothetical protein